MRQENNEDRMKVYLIGAGPGDPGLLTIKGKDILEKADVVVYDYLANDTLLGYARPDAERIYVGKVAGNHALPQDGINKLIIEKAKEGKIVARLKGGDPYIFGRGGARAYAEKSGVEFLGEIPIIQSIMDGADAGTPAAGIDSRVEGCILSKFYIKPQPSGLILIDKVLLTGCLPL